MAQWLRLGRWLLGGLIALNVALALLLAAVLLGWRGSSSPTIGPMPSPHALRQALPRERAELVNELFETHKPTIRKAMREQRRARRELIRSLRQENVEQAVLTEQFAAIRQTEQHTAETVHAMLSDLLSRLTPDERRQVAELFTRRGQEGRSRREERRSRDGEHQSDEPPGEDSK
nr:periplasmic heavy metal sensor [Pseudomarimonas arenosa]